MRIVIWCGEAANQKALANKISSQFEVAGIVIDSGHGIKKKRKYGQLLAILFDRLRFRKIYRAWNNLMQYYDRTFPDWPDIPVTRVQGINDSQADIFTKGLKPDLIVVSGTALVKEPLLSISATIGIINLHTGLSPYVKGGPNCTNWCIANNEWHLVGNTIMWLNAGIDSGNIISTETVEIRNTQSLDEAHRLVMDNAHELYLKVIKYFNKTNFPYQSVSQSKLGKGKLYLTKMWTSSKRAQLLYNWKKRKSYQGTFPEVKTISLDSWE